MECDGPASLSLHQATSPTMPPITSALTITRDGAGETPLKRGCGRRMSLDNRTQGLDPRHTCLRHSRSSWQRINTAKRLHVTCLLPCVDQFNLVLGCPFHDEARRTRRKTAANYAKCICIDNHVITTVLGVKVRRIVVVVVHFDHDTVKPTKFRNRLAPSDSEIPPLCPFQ